MVDNKVESVGVRQNFQNIQKFAGNVKAIKLITNNMGGGILSFNDETFKTLHQKHPKGREIQSNF